MSFSFDQLSAPVQKALKSIGIEKPTEIQQKAIPTLLESNTDFVGQAQTGTGKTAAFLLPLIENLDYEANSIQALVIAPTRELAAQVHTELEKFAINLPLRTAIVYGGAPYNKQIDQIKKRKAQVIVGTPGRVIDLIERGVIKLENCKNFIIDEADEMLNMGFLEDVKFMIEKLPTNRKIWMFSATMPKPIVDLIRESFSNPEIMSVKKETLSNASISQYYCCLQKRDFVKALKLIIESDKDMYAVIFCETKWETKELADKLADNGVLAQSLHGDLSQAQREQAMGKFKDKRSSILICTDVAARGIDVSHVTHVFNMGLPRTKENYVHRIGRTGRAGQTGTSISFVTPSDLRGLKTVEKMTGQKMELYRLPDPQTLKKAKVEGELEKMNKLRDVLIELGDDFKLDESFAPFESYFDGLSRDQIIKLLFSFHFKKDLKRIDEGLMVKAQALVADKSRQGRRERRDRGRGTRSFSRDNKSEGRSRRRNVTRAAGSDRSRSESNRDGDQSRSRRNSSDKRRTSSRSKHRR